MDASENKRATYWCTRDLHQGKLSELVEVWVVKPNLVRRDDNSVSWMSDGPTGIEGRYQAWTLDTCLQHVGTIPETERECIRVDGDD